MNRVSQTDGFMAGKSDADTSALYKAAKIITAHLVSCQNSKTENGLYQRKEREFS